MRNLGAIIDAAERSDARVIFLTQPTLWRSGLSPAEQARLWMGGPPLDQMADGAEFYSVEALARGMQDFNDFLLRVCRARSVECLDVASGMPREAALFWDDAHYTEAGSRRLANLVADYLVSVEPLAGLPSQPRAGAAEPR